MLICIYIRIYVCVCVCVCVYVCMYTFVYTYIIYVCMWTYMCVSIYIVRLVVRDRYMFADSRRVPPALTKTWTRSRSLGALWICPSHDLNLLGALHIMFKSRERQERQTERERERESPKEGLSRSRGVRACERSLSRSYCTARAPRERSLTLLRITVSPITFLGLFLRFFGP